MKIRKRVSALGFIAGLSSLPFLGTLVVGCEPTEGPEQVGEVEQAVWDGDDSVLDDANTYNFVGSFNTTGGGCSGVLITPRWVLTAAHCFDTPGTISEDIIVTFNVDPTGMGTDADPSNDPDVTQTFTHRNSDDGDVIRWIANPDPGNANDVARDLAAFRLSDRVPDDVATPIHIPTEVDVCPSGFGSGTGFVGTSIGFGSGMYTLCGDIERLRRHSTHDQFFRLGQIEGAVYNKTYVNSLAICSQYSGTARGDSGGAFLDEDENLCGIISGMDPPGLDPAFPFVFYTSNRMAAVDSEEALAWLATVEVNGHAISDISGNWDGECPAYVDSCDDGNCDDLDSDDDGNVDLCDVCPWVAHEDQFDDDNDGVSDCVDLCPQDPIQAGAPSCDHFGDFDCDGSCDSNDDCPFTSNPSHANSNPEAEDRWGAGVMGDACEPVPMPAGNPSDYEVLDSASVHSSFFESVTELRQQDTVSIQTRKSRRAAGLSGGTASVSVVSVPTQFRFCQNDPTKVACDDASLVNTSQLHVEVLDPKKERASYRYHRITMSFSPTRGANTTVSYNDTWREWTWNYASDAAFWQTTGLVDVPPPENDLLVHGGPASGLDGRFWIHAATTAGMPGNDVGTGTHGPSALTGTQQLSSRYFWLDPEFITHQWVSHPLQLRRPFFLWQTLSDPGPEYLEPVVAGVLPGDAQLVLPVEGDAVAVLGLEGRAQVLGEDRLAAGLADSFADASLVWAGAAEPTAYIGQGAPIAVALKSNGKAILERVTVDGEGGLRGVLDGGAAPPSAGPIGTLERHKFTAVYSKALEQVFLIGGFDADGHRAADILRAGLGDAGFTSLRPSIRPRGVRSATYSFRDDALYVLDSRHKECDSSADVDACEDSLEGTGNERTRFLRIDARDGNTTELAAWMTDDLPPEMWLGSDAVGRVMFSMSSGAEAAHTVVRYDSTIGTIQRLVRGVGELAFAAAVDVNGFVAYTHSPDGYAGTRYGELNGSNRSLSQLPEML